MLTSKHFKAIAKCIKDCDNVFDLVDSLEDYFLSQNERFDKEKFEKSCGFKEKEQ